MDWGEVSAIAAVGAVALTVIAGGIKWIIGEARRSDQKAEAADAKADAAHSALAAFREEVAKQYVSQQMIEKFEIKVFDAVDRMGDRLDAAMNRLAERLDRVLETRKP